MLPFAWLDRLATPLASATLRGAIILLGALVVTTLLRRRSAAARHAVWAGAIAMQLVVLVLGAWGPHWRVATPRVVADAISPIVAVPAAEQPVATPAAPDMSTVAPASKQVVLSISTPTPRAAEVTSAPSLPVVHDQPALRGRDLLLFAWLAGALFVLLRLAAGTAVVAALARRGARVEDGGWLSLTQRLATSLHIDRPLILMRGSRVGVPITWGIIYPIVLLPDDADGWTEERRRFVLVHEMAHVKRLDALTQLVGQLVLAVFWFNPLVWIANRRMQLEREHACDDYVLRHGTAPTMYAEELLAMVRQLGTPEHRSAQPAFAALAMARRSEFEGRMLSILDPVLDRHPLSRGRTIMSAFAALLVVIPLAALQPYRAAAATPPAPTPLPLASAAHPDEFPPSFKISFNDAPPSAQQHVNPSLPSAPSSPSLPSSTARPTPPVPASQPAMAAMPASPAAPVSPISPVTPASPATTVVRGQYDCGSVRFDGSSSGTTTHINSDSDDDAPYVGMMDYYTYTGSRCAQASVSGRITYTGDESDVADMTEGSHTFFRERTPSEDRSLNVVRMNGSLLRSYRRNGASAAWDDDARRWFAGFLPGVLADAGLNVKPRVERWRAQGGVDRVLKGIGSMRSSGAKVSHYDALLDGPVSGDELDRIVRQMTMDLSGSSGDMRSALTKVAPGLRRSINSGTVATLLRAIAAIPSSGDRTAVLRTYSATDNRELLLGIMSISAGIPSSGDRASLLRGTVARYLGGRDDALRDAWFAAGATIPSSGDMRTVLATAIPYAAGQDEVAMQIIRGAGRISSSGDRAGLLIALAHSGAVRTTPLRDAYTKSVSQMSSSDDMRRALEAVARQ